MLQRNISKLNKKIGLLLWLLTIIYPLSALGVYEKMSPSDISKIQRNAGLLYSFKGNAADNPAQGWRIVFGADGVEVFPNQQQASESLKFGLARIGDSNKLIDLRVNKREANGNRVSYQKGVVEEWYLNGPLGLEQGFNIPHPLGKDLVLELHSNWAAEQQGQDVKLSHGNDSWLLGSLHAVDSAGRILPSTMKVLNGKVRLEIVTGTARYPIIVDPVLTRRATLTAKDQTKYLGFGRSVAISGDGNTALVGTDGNAAYIYTMTTTGWVQKQKLVKPTTLRCNSNGSWFGWSVALSKDGGTAIVGASGIFTYYSWGIPIPLFYSCADLPVYVKKGTQWVLEKILTSSNITKEDMFGSAVSISDDGKKLIAGAQLTKCSTSTDRCGSAYFFERGASGWALQKRFLNTVSYDAWSGYFGATTAMSGDGLWALVGAPGGNTTWAFQRKGLPAGWTQTQVMTFPASRLTKDFGTALALSAAGDRALISAESTTNISDCKGDYTDCGAVYSYKRVGTKLTLDSVFTAADSHSYNYFGESLALSANGTRAIVGTSSADCINGNCGAAYLFDLIGTVWKQQGRVTGPSAGLGGTDLGGNFGGSVTLSDAGNRLLVGAHEDSCPLGKECGKVYYYTITP